MKTTFVTYFDCTAALDGNCEARAHAAQPFCAWLASSAPPRWAGSGSAGRRRSFEGSRPSESGRDRIR